MNRHILEDNVQQYIRDHINDPITEIALRRSPFEQVSSSELAEQIDGKKRSRKKLPSWFNTPGIYYPSRLALEQCSSELTAKYKAALAKGKTLADLTSGFGVDSVFFSAAGFDVVSCEKQAELAWISKHNSEVLGKRIDVKNTDGLAYLETGGTFDTIYIDPSRRNTTGRVFYLADCLPDVPANLDLLLSRAGRIIVKTSPMLDISSSINELKHVSEIHVISIANECKEVLYIIDHNRSDNEIIVNCALLDSERQYRYKLSDEAAFQISDYAAPQAYLYEPDASLMKAGCFKIITRDYAVDKLHQHTHLYTSPAYQPDFPGRCFHVRGLMSFGEFNKNKRSNRKANIIARNFPLSVDHLRKKLRIADGGEDYLLFFTDRSGDLLVVEAERVK